MKQCAGIKCLKMRLFTYFPSIKRLIRILNRNDVSDIIIFRTFWGGPREDHFPVIHRCFQTFQSRVFRFRLPDGIFFCISGVI
ncbi:MAG: hypothetical protein CVV64_14630 [Candidatus Wallbacteria bacterium HGW-Wallbacteria-1]|uniref:Uncharacterized protein n=1 Tax=Candidatus Wallbacteria bacterium HGW-Wallbacteria-1 TaxID=2013854 RepID=A0A2N1PM04_9BACT|nr:MAG: hypothetical protein CVV64_14630 [Candidatus Wallbacteria bacterium HGW-Wallbacteria-1]